MSARRAVAAGLLLLGLAASSSLAGAASPAKGEALYRHGLLGSGAPLEAHRAGGAVGMKGAEAACVNCHRRSGLGSTEGSITIPPITGEYLFHAREAGTAARALTYVEGMHGNRLPYTDATLARAIREGVDSEGNALSTLMPRFALDDPDMAGLIEYLKTLDVTAAPGVTDTLLHFATVITPDADPVARDGMLDVLNHYFADKNAIPFGPSPKMRTSGKTMYSKSMYVANRHWQLHVWQLSGPASTWHSQLQRYLAAEPVMALVSGLGGRDWAPVHDFCEQERVPCLFPNVEVPTVADGDFYSLYFSKGVLLEAELVAKAIAEGEGSDGPPVKVVQQIYRAGDTGEAAARALTLALTSQGIEVRNRVLAAGKPGRGVAAALHGASTADALVLWLRAADVAAVGEAPAPARGVVFMSGLMGGLENAPLPSSWRARVRLTYPVDLPDRRVVRLDYPLGWFRFRHIPVVAEQVQADTYLACGVLAETLSHMADTIKPDYLVERTQETLDHRILTGYYPRLNLATGQTLASKGSYLVRFSEPTGTKLRADGDWTVP
jgi:hypothetical protein